MSGRVYDRLMVPLEVGCLRPVRKVLVSGLRGRILDLGAGTGANFRFFHPQAEVIAVEPDRDMRLMAERRRPAHVRLIEGRAEAITLPDRWADHVVCALVLCSVKDLACSLAECVRVLKPGGSLVFLEHVRGQGWVGRLHDGCTPCWAWLAGGCHLNRRTLDAFGAAGLVVEQCWTPFRILATPFLAGIARKPGAG
jgi:ubiquinone/menaquinone biosynthesis C-methylase UbiE